VRVLFVTNSRDRGSTSRMLEAWADLMPDYGIEPVVSVGGTGPLFEALRQKGITPAIRPLGFIPQKQWPFPFVAATLKLAATIRASGVCLVHLNEHDMYMVVSRAARLAAVPLVVHIHYRLQEEYARWLFKPPYLPARLFFPSATNLRCSADAIAKTIPDDRCRVILNGLDLPRFGSDPGARSRLRAEWQLDDDTVAIGTACAISPIKRLDHFVRLIAALKARGLRVRGFIAGQAHTRDDAQLVRELEGQVSRLGLGDALTFLGYIEPSEPLYHAWDLYVSTSEYESFGMSVLEAMACRRAVVAYAVGATEEVGKNGIRVVQSGDEQALLKCCVDLCENHEGRRAVGEAARMRALSAFDIRRSVAILSDEYRAVVTAGPRSAIVRRIAAPSGGRLP
jgi:L-malate glycosyltransferase